MENQNNSSQDCGCGDGCCTPQKLSPWKKWAFITILLVAGVIVTVKLAGNNGTLPASACCETTESSDCCEVTPEPQEVSSCCSEPAVEPAETTPCCPESK